MIEVVRFSGMPLVLNADLIEAVEASPDTSILLTNGRRYVVKNSVPEVLEMVVTWKRRCFIQPLTGEKALERRMLEERSQQEK
jgi:flagellar protein FlbD